MTLHTLRLKTAALYREEVRRGLLSPAAAAALKRQIEQQLYESNSSKQKEEEELRACTFKPQINSSSKCYSNNDKRPWWVRLHAQALRIKQAATNETKLQLAAAAEPLEGPHTSTQHLSVHPSEDRGLEEKAMLLLLQQQQQQHQKQQQHNAAKGDRLQINDEGGKQLRRTKGARLRYKQTHAALAAAAAAAPAAAAADDDDEGRELLRMYLEGFDRR